VYATAMTRGMETTDEQLRFEIVGARRLSTIFIATMCTIGGLGFLLAGLSIYSQKSLLPFTQDLVNNPLVRFYPQGATLLAYGTLGTLFALYYWVTILLNVGAGYNEFNKKSGKVTIYRSGFPGKNRHINIEYPLSAIQGIRVLIKDGLNPRRSIYLKVKGKNPIPLSGVGQPPAINVVEEQAAVMARFLGVGIEGI